MAKKRIPIGVDSFGKLVNPEANYLFSDKTLMIKDIIQSGAEVILITRPRRWGKTLNMSMLQHFFAPSVIGKPTQGLFGHLAIAKEKAEDGQNLVQKYQGQYPVISITLKDIRESTMQGAINKIKLLVRELYGDHDYLLESNKLRPDEKKQIQKFLDQESNLEELSNAVKDLCQLLHKHTGKLVYVLVDEYDTPIHAAYEKHYFDEMLNFLREFFSGAFKNNPYLEKGVITGILRIAKENLFSGVNNLEEYTLLENTYSQYYGFTEEEVNQLFNQIELDHDQNKIKDWYNGYRSGELVVYNPWSIMKCLNAGGKLEPYWINTGNNNLIRKLLLNASTTIKKKLEALMLGYAITGTIDKHISFQDMNKTETALWSLLLFAGYLKVNSIELDETGLFNCQLAVPNSEVMTIYNRFFVEWFKEKLGMYYDNFLNQLLEGNAKGFTISLGEYLLQTSSVHDFSRYPEAFYHGLVLGLIATLKQNYHIYSNRESGLGRYDVMLIPKSNTQARLGIILEFKHAKQDENIIRIAKQALKQIDDYHYQAELEAHGHITRILKVGLAFSYKAVQSAYAFTSLNVEEEPEIELSQEYAKEIDFFESSSGQLGDEKKSEGEDDDLIDDQPILLPLSKRKNILETPESSQEVKDDIPLVKNKKQKLSSSSSSSTSATLISQIGLLKAADSQEDEEEIIQYSSNPD